MNSLSNGFLYVVGFGWVLAECCLVAVAGNSTPILLFLLAFVLIFSILGCLNLSDAAVNKVGALSSALLAASLVIFSIGTITAGAPVFGVLKLLAAAVFVIASLVAFTAKSDSHAAHHHH
jgi:hypothetical protein